MKCSRNELTAIMRKAAIGSGCAVGVADEIARAACTLQASGYDGISLLLTALDACVDAPQEINRNVFDVDTWFPAVTIARTGPSVFDALLLQSQAGHTELSLSSIDVPFLLAGLAANRCMEQALKFTIAFSCGAEAVVSRSGITLEGVIPMGPCDGRVMLYRDAGVTADSVSTETQALSLDVDTTLWNRCAVLAAHTYVRSTEASRLDGAGAGLTDND
ncbi:MAG: DUF3726 domain-containing protein [Granulosicoccus sp.]|nr:DUF3726 domain-containing protein [Granulosicoccus sp.]